MPSYIAFGKDIGITVNAEPDEVAEKLAGASPGKLVPFEGTTERRAASRKKKQTFFVNGGGMAYVVRIGTE